MQIRPTYHTITTTIICLFLTIAAYASFSQEKATAGAIFILTAILYVGSQQIISVLDKKAKLDD